MLYASIYVLLRLPCSVAASCNSTNAECDLEILAVLGCRPNARREACFI